MVAVKNEFVVTWLTITKWYFVGPPQIPALALGVVAALVLLVPPPPPPHASSTSAAIPAALPVRAVLRVSWRQSF